MRRVNFNKPKEIIKSLWKGSIVKMQFVKKEIAKKNKLITI
jgi:hypothetical protein